MLFDIRRMNLVVNGFGFGHNPVSKEWATHRWKSEWELFLRLESSKAEAGYAEIKNIYNIVMRSGRAKENLL
jgi:hypothetical protein